MDLRLTEADVALRDEIRAFCGERQPAVIREKLISGKPLSPDDIRTWQLILDERGWAAPHWPKEWGGQEWNATQLFIYNEELLRAPAMLPENHNVTQVGPVIIAFGTDEQKQHFLPRIRRMDYWFCQGFSEPHSGSDLASLKTRAVKEGDHYIVNGQKMWTTQGHNADWMFALVRTDPAATKHRGISYLLINLHSPGITIQPIITLGNQRVNAIFFDDVRVPVANRIGEENRGWDYAKYLMGNSRVNVARIGLSVNRVQKAKAFAIEALNEGQQLAMQPRFREKVAALEVELKALEITAMRIVSDRMKSAGKHQDPKSSILKLKGAELQQLSAELLLDVAGPLAIADQFAYLDGRTEECMGPAWGAGAAPTFYLSRQISIAGGTSEIQRNIIAKRILGL